MNLLGKDPTDAYRRFIGRNGFRQRFLIMLFISCEETLPDFAKNCAITC